MDNTNSLSRLRNSVASNGLETSLRKRQQTELAARAARGTKVLLLDTSSSMDSSNHAGETRIDILWDIVQQLRAERIEFITCTFNSKPSWSDFISKPIPDGGTDLHKALRFVRDAISDLHSITLIHDGEPSLPSLCLEIAREMRVPINVLFVGDENDTYSLEFARALANETGGYFASSDININQLNALKASNEVRLMLAAESAVSDDKKPIAL